VEGERFVVFVGSDVLPPNSETTAITVIYDDYILEQNHIKERSLPPSVLQLGHEASILAISVLQGYIFDPAPPPGTMTRGSFDFFSSFCFLFSVRRDSAISAKRFG
jgi:hypothetical protein